MFHKFWAHSVIWRDSFLYFAPYKFHIGEALRAGEIWKWNPYQFLGLPFVGDILAGWFYPLNVLYAVLPFEPAHRIFILVHYPLAALFMALLLIDLGLGRFSAWFGGMAFAFSGYMIGMHDNVVFLIGPALAPLALLFFHRALVRSPAYGFLSGAVLALQVFAGEPQSALLTAAAASAAGAVHAVCSRRAAGPAAALAITGLSSALLSLVQLLPTWELLSQSLRRSGLDWRQASFYSLHPLSLFEFIWPTPFGAPHPDRNYWGLFTVGDSPANIDAPWTATNYLGLYVFALAIFGVGAGRRRWRWWAGAGMAVFIVLALGRYTPVYHLLYDTVPFLDRFRYPAKFLPWFCGFTALAAALGLSELLRRLRENPPSLFKPALILFALVPAITAVSFFALSRLAGEGDAYLAALDHLAAGARQVLVINLLMAGSLMLAARGKIAAERWRWIFLALALTGWQLANVPAMYEGPPDIFSFPSTAARVISPGGRPPLGEFRIIREEFGFTGRDPDLPGYGRTARECWFARDSLQRNLDTLEGFEDLIGYNTAAPALGLALLDGPGSNLLALYNVRYVISRPDRGPLAWAQSEKIFRDEARGFSVLRLSALRPRAYFAPRALRAGSASEAERLVQEADLGGAVVITSAKGLEPGPGAGALVPARIVSYRPDRVEIEVEAPRAGWLILSDRFYPGWEAAVDGTRTEIFPANVMVRAVRVEPGRHRVVFAYRPWTFRVGAGVSLPSWFALMAGCLLVLARWRRSG